MIRPRELLVATIATVFACVTLSAQTVRTLPWSGMSAAPSALVVDERGTLYVAEYLDGTSRIHRVTPTKTDVVIERLLGPVALAAGPAGTLFVASETSGDVHRIDADGNIATIASGFERPTAIAFANGMLFVTNAITGTISRVAEDGSIAMHASGLRDPFGLTAANDGSLFVTSADDGTISRIDANGHISLVTTIPDGSRAKLGHLVIGPQGVIYVASRGHQVVYAIQRDVVRMHAGSGIAGHADGAAPNARFHRPTGIALNGGGSVLVGEYQLPRLRQIDPRDDDTVYPLIDDGDLPLVDTSRVRPDSAHYRVLVESGARTDTTGVVRVTSARAAGRFLRAERWETRERRGVDSTIAAAANLRIIASTRVETAFALSMLDVVAAALPLRHGYSTVLPVWAPRFGLARAELRVRALEKVAGRSAPLWVVDVALPDAMTTLWLEYTSRQVVRVRHDFGRGSALVLVRESATG